MPVGSGLVRELLAETLGLSASALGGVQVVLTGTVSPPPTEQPAGISEGLRQAAERLNAGFAGAAAALRGVPRRGEGGPVCIANVRSGEGLGAAAARVLRAAPGALVAPLSGGAGAARAALLGARNALDPERFNERRLLQ